MLSWLRGSGGWGTRIDDFDPEAVAGTVKRLRGLFGGEDAYFPLDVVGLDTLPKTPCLIVSNHSGGTTIPDAWGLAMSWYGHFSVHERPVHALAHEMLFALRGTAEPFARRGVLRADRKLALAALRDWGRDVVVWPGGDLDTWRPYSERYKCRFANRKGYARLALEAGVPIVPVAHAGSHETLVVLTDGQGIARRLHLPELFRAHIFPIHLSLPFMVGIGPLPHLPPPVRMRYRFAPAIWPEPGAHASDEAAVVDLDARVRASMQHELDVLAETAPPPGEQMIRAVRQIARRARGVLRMPAAA